MGARLSHGGPVGGPQGARKAVDTGRGRHRVDGGLVDHRGGRGASAGDACLVDDGRGRVGGDVDGDVDGESAAGRQHPVVDTGSRGAGFAIGGRAIAGVVGDFEPDESVDGEPRMDRYPGRKGVGDGDAAGGDGVAGIGRLDHMVPTPVVSPGMRWVGETSEVILNLGVAADAVAGTAAARRRAQTTRNALAMRTGEVISGISLLTVGMQSGMWRRKPITCPPPDCRVLASGGA